MGCNTSSNRKLYQRLDEFELKQHSKVLYIKNEEVTLHMPKHKVGDYFAVEINNKDYHYFEERFRELIGKELALQKVEVLLASKEAFITSILRDEKLRKGVLKIVRRKGLMQAYRWKAWYLLAIYDNRFKPDGALTSRRQKIFEKLIQKEDKEVEDIVNKDVMRTARHKELFKDVNSIGNLQLYRVCKAIGKFFPSSGYIQGMNFIAAFILQVNGMDEFETFNFIVSLWKKEKNLFYGMYEPGFPVLYFMKYAFERFLEITNPKIYKTIIKLNFPAELWIVKWFLSFFTFSLDKEYVLRIFDFIMVNDVLGPVYVALAIADQLSSLFDTEDFIVIGEVVQCREKLSEVLNFHKFVKALKNLDFDSKIKLGILRDYHKSLKPDVKKQFSPFFMKFEKHFMRSQLYFYDDFGFDRFCNDYDMIGLTKLTAMVTHEQNVNTSRETKENNKKGSLRKQGSATQMLKSDLLISPIKHKDQSNGDEATDSSILIMRN